MPAASGIPSPSLVVSSLLVDNKSLLYVKGRDRVGALPEARKYLFQEERQVS